MTALLLGCFFAYFQSLACKTDRYALFMLIPLALLFGLFLEMIVQKMRRKRGKAAGSGWVQGGTEILMIALAIVVILLSAHAFIVNPDVQYFLNLPSQNPQDNTPTLSPALQSLITAQAGPGWSTAPFPALVAHASVVPAYIDITTYARAAYLDKSDWFYVRDCAAENVSEIPCLSADTACRNARDFLRIYLHDHTHLVMQTLEDCPRKFYVR